MRDTMPVTVVGGDDNALAWIVRRFYKTSFVLQPSVGISGPVVLIPSENTKPTLGAAYVGEPFALYNGWDRSSVQYWDVIPWLYEQNTRVEPAANQKITLWVRADVYGVPKGTTTKTIIPVVPAPINAPGK